MARRRTPVDALCRTAGFLSCGGSADCATAGAGGPFAGSRAVRRLRHCADRSPAGRGLPHHLRACAGGLAVDAGVPRDGVLGGGGVGVQHPPVFHAGQRIGTEWCVADLSGVVDRCPVGAPDLGCLVGVGRAPHVRADPALPLHRLHWPAGRHRRPAPRRPGGRIAGSGRRGQRAGDLFFGAMVEHAAPGRNDHAAQCAAHVVVDAAGLAAVHVRFLGCHAGGGAAAPALHCVGARAAHPMGRTAAGGGA